MAMLRRILDRFFRVRRPPDPADVAKLEAAQARILARYELRRRAIVSDWPARTSIPDEPYTPQREPIGHPLSEDEETKT